MEPDKMSTASSVGAERRPLLEALVLERRTLFACTILVGLCSFVWIAAICTEHWVDIDGGDGKLVPLTNRYFYYGTAGLWQTCRHVYIPPPPPPPPPTAAPPPTPPPPPTAAPRAVATAASKGAAKNISMPSRNETTTTTAAPPPKPKDLTNITLFIKCTNYLQEPENVTKDYAYNAEVAKNCRTMVSFGIISLFVMAMGCGFSAYTFINPRYMFKRLAAGIHFITTSCTLVSGQIMTTTVDIFKKEVKVVYPDGAVHHYGVSWYLAWFVVMVNLASGLVFLWYSRKRKGNKAATDELAMADEPTIIGR